MCLISLSHSLILFDFVIFSSGAFEVLVPMLLKHRQLLQSKSFVSNYLVIKKELGDVGPWIFEDRKTVTFPLRCAR